jgi:hypothetical protein
MSDAEWIVMLIRVDKSWIFVREYGRVVEMLSLTQSLLGGFLECLISGDGVINFEGHINLNITPIHNILSTAPPLNISQKALGTLPDVGNVMPKHVAATI